MTRSRLLLVTLSLALITGCAGSPRMTKHPSPHFQTVSQHLDLGGTVYLYVDMDGDIEMLSKEIQTWLNALPEVNVDLPKISKALGLDQLTAFGLSSVQDGKVYHNKAFVYRRGQPQGLLRFGGTTPHAFEIPSFAPADADVVLEADILGSSVYKDLEPLIADLGGDQALSELDRNIPGLNLTWRRLLGMLDTHLLAVVRLDPENSTPVPGGFPMPRVDAVLALDSLAGLFDAIQQALREMPMAKHGEDGQLVTIQFALPLPPGLQWFSPVLAKHKQSGRVYLATHLDFLKSCLNNQKALAESPNYLRAIAGLPQPGSSMSYTSPDLGGKLTRIVDGIPSAGAAEKQIIRSVMDLVLPEPGVPTATVSTPLKDGLYTASNTTSSHKESLLLAQYMNPMVLGILSAVAIPAFVRYEDRAASSPVKVEASQN